MMHVPNHLVINIAIADNPKDPIFIVVKSEMTPTALGSILNNYLNEFALNIYMPSLKMKVMVLGAPTKAIETLYLYAHTRVNISDFFIERIKNDSENETIYTEDL